MLEKKIKDTTLDLLICTGIYIVLIAFLFQLQKTPKDVRSYPSIVLGGALLFNTILLIQTFVKIKKTSSDTKGIEVGCFKSTIYKIFAYICLIAIYIFLIPKIGYLLSTYLFLTAMLLFIGVRNWKILIILPIVMTLVIYFLFTYVLVVILPKGTWITLAL